LKQTFTRQLLRTIVPLNLGGVTILRKPASMVVAGLPGHVIFDRLCHARTLIPIPIPIIDPLSDERVTFSSSSKLGVSAST
jgi:hypothetical protein